MALWGKTNETSARPTFLKGLVGEDGVITSGAYAGKTLVYIHDGNVMDPVNRNKGMVATGWYVLETRPAGRSRAELIIAISDPGEIFIDDPEI